MEKPFAAILSTLVGFVLMIAGSAGYVSTPKVLYQAVFIIGLLALIGGYAFISVRNKASSEQLRSIESRESIDGYVYYMDGEPERNDATIVDLTRR